MNWSTQLRKRGPKKAHEASERQIKKLRPRHYEIVIRYLQGQKLTQIARDMELDVSWVSIVVNSPIFQEEIERRLNSDEQKVMEKLRGEPERELEALARAMRYNEGEIPNGSVVDVDRLRAPVEGHSAGESGDPGMGDRLVRMLGAKGESHLV